MFWPLLRLAKMAPASQPWRSLMVLGVRCQQDGVPNPDT